MAAQCGEGDRQMAGSGPPPSENRRRRNADTYGDVKTRLVVDDELRGPELKGGPGPGRRWKTGTREWWDTWRRSPQAAAFLETDWQRLRLLANLVDQYLGKPHHMALAEIRLNESLVGATVVDRLKARMKVEQAQPEGDKTQVTALDDYRNRISG
jgi:hypothetical protein